MLDSMLASKQEHQQEYSPSERLNTHPPVLEIAETPPRPPSALLPDNQIKIEPDVTIEPVPAFSTSPQAPLQTNQEAGKSGSLKPEIVFLVDEEASSPVQNHRQYDHPTEMDVYEDNEEEVYSLDLSLPQAKDEEMEPADLSNKKPEKVTCVPEIEFIKEEINDAASDYSNSSDPERLEVDMSQVNNYYQIKC